MSLDYPLTFFFFFNLAFNYGQTKIYLYKSKQVELVKGRKRNMSLIQITIGFLYYSLKRKKKSCE